IVDLGVDVDSSQLLENEHLVYSGSNINGKGFVLTPRERTSFIEIDPTCSKYIKPYLTGDDINNGRRYAPSRFVIDFGDCDVDEVKRCPTLYNHLSSTVRLQRQGSSEERLRERWWQHSRPARDLYARCASLERLLAASRLSNHM